MKNLREKQAKIGHRLDKAFEMGADGNDSEAMRIVHNIAAELERMTPEERGSILNIHFEKTLKKLLV